MAKPRPCGYSRVLIALAVLGWLNPALLGAPRYDPIIQRVLTLLPRPPSQVVIVDVGLAADDVREALRMVDAFIVKGRRVVYLTSHNEILQGTVSGWPMYEHMLAAIIWHEMAHIDGADEEGAQRKEEGLWRRFVADGRVDRVTALRYLKLMADRHSDQ